MSPNKRKVKLRFSTTPIKRTSKTKYSLRKRLKMFTDEDEEMEAIRRKNLKTACELVSYKNYIDYRARYLLVYLPSCVNTSCKHRDKNESNLCEMPSHAVVSFKTEMRHNVWYEALELCQMCLNATQYLSAAVLKDIVEIMLNAHEDDYRDHTVKHIVDKCQQVLMQNFSTHPPGLGDALRFCYYHFLVDPMDQKKNTFSNRSQFECNKGFVKYCMNRLEHELSADSVDGPIVDKTMNPPEYMTKSVKGAYWHMEHFEIFESLNRQERIERLFAVLEAVIELLQFDLAIVQARCTHDQTFRMRAPRLMECVIWYEEHSGTVTAICRQIIKIFSQMIHLQYPDAMVKIITIWLNTMIQTFYVRETGSTNDYPNTVKYCREFAEEFYKIISDMPYDSIIRILERIEPSFMRHLIGVLHVNKILPTDEACIITILINFFNDSKWKTYPVETMNIKFSKKLFYAPKKVNEKTSFLLETCTITPLEDTENTTMQNYAKMPPITRVYKTNTTVGLNHIIHSLYLTLEAYLNAYDIQSVHETWINLNNNVTDSESIILEHSDYTITESLIDKYRHILKTTEELINSINDQKLQGELPEFLIIFENLLESILFSHES